MPQLSLLLRDNIGSPHLIRTSKYSLTGHPPHRSGQRFVGSAAIAGFCPHRTHRAAFRRGLFRKDLMRIDICATLLDNRCREWEERPGVLV